MEIVGSLSGDVPPIKSDTAVRNAWQAYTALADRYNEPGRFTAMIGYEWTAIGGYNLHRNVHLPRRCQRREPHAAVLAVRQQEPRGSLDAPRRTSRTRTGAEVLAIPHNGNLSNGRMFTVETFDGKPLTEELAATRIRYEPLIEVTQIKGDGEVASAAFAQRRVCRLRDLGQVQPERHRGEEARDAPVGIRARGAEDRPHAGERSSASIRTSSAWSAAPTRTRRWPRSRRTISSASTPASSPSRTAGSTSSSRRRIPKFTIHGWQQAAGGYAAVWATENTREAIFDAMKRKETYATTGPRMTVRFFGGWDFTAEDAPRACRPQPATPRACRWAATCRNAPAGKAPTFLVAAMKDPYSGNLDRIQIVKGWLDADGEDPGEGLRRRLERRPPAGRGRQASAGRQHRRRRAGDLDNTIGDPELIGVWTDPDFDPAQSRLLLRQGHRDPDPALDRLRGAAFRG